MLSNTNNKNHCSSLLLLPSISSKMKSVKKPKYTIQHQLSFPSYDSNSKSVVEDFTWLFLFFSKITDIVPTSDLIALFSKFDILDLSLIWQVSNWSYQPKQELQQYYQYYYSYNNIDQIPYRHLFICMEITINKKFQWFIA